MKAFFKKLTEETVALIDQQADFAMAIRCRTHECGYILKILRSRDEADGDNLYWLFSQDFNDPAGYVSAIVAEFAQQRELACAALIGEGKPEWPPLPQETIDAGTAPAGRLRALMEYTRALLPPGDDHLVVWALFPLNIRSHALYGRFIGELVHHDFPRPWCHHMRLYLRDDSHQPAVYQEFMERHQARARYYAPDLSQAAMEKAVEDEAADPTAPMDERMQNLLVLANLDLSHRRYAQSLQKHDLLLGYYQGTGNLPLIALALNGMGEVHERMGKDDKARELFLGAMGQAVESNSQPIMLNVALNMANLELKAKQWDLAESYYTTAHMLATQLLNPQVKIHAMNNIGYAQYMQGKKAEAVANWEGGATLAKEVEETDLRRQSLTRLRDHYKSVMNQAKLSATERELAALAPLA